jgi:hypothetical protein
MKRRFALEVGRIRIRSEVVIERNVFLEDNYQVLNGLRRGTGGPVGPERRRADALERRATVAFE